jgi:sec-independent protein translocase protein TatA
MGLSLGHLLVVVIALVLLFGLKRLPQAMGDLGKGIREFKDGLHGGKSLDKPSESASLPSDDSNKPS